MAVISSTEMSWMANLDSKGVTHISLIRKDYCLPQDNSPDHSKGHLDISVNDFLNCHCYMECQLFLSTNIYTFGSNGHQFDTLAGDEIEGFVDIGNFVKP